MEECCGAVAQTIFKMNFYTEEKPDIWWQDGMRYVYDYITTAQEQPDPLIGSMSCSKYEGINFAWGGSLSNSFKSLIKSKGKKVWFYAGGPFDVPEIHIPDLVFCEDKWSQKEFRKRGVNAKIAFGINTKTYYKIPNIKKEWEYIYPAAFAGWKRHDLFIEKVTDEAARSLCVGEMQEHEKHIYEKCMKYNITVMPKVPPYVVNWLYNQSEKVYLPADIMGGCQRAVWEAKHIGLQVEVAEDNPRLLEMLEQPVKTEEDYLQDVLKEIDKL